MKKVILVMITVLLTSYSCKIINFSEKAEEREGIIYGYVKETFSGQPISDIKVVVENASGGELSTITDSSGYYEINIGSAGSYTITYNWNRERSKYVPRKIEGFSVVGRTEISLDLAEQSKLIMGKGPLSAIIGAKRGGGAYYSCGRYLPNYKWVDQPKHFYYSPQVKRNPTVWKYYLRIMLKDMPKYTGGFLHPSYEDLEPAPSQKGIGEMVVYFDTDVPIGLGGQNGNTIKNGKIISSFASAAGRYWNMKSEILDSVYYGDEESSLGPSYDSEWDKNWGDFNWKYRQNVNKMTCDSQGLREKDVFGESTGALYTTVGEYTAEILSDPLSSFRKTQAEIETERIRAIQNKQYEVYRNWRKK